MDSRSLIRNNEFVATEDFEISEESRLERFDLDNLEESLDLVDATFSFYKIESLEQLSKASNISDGRAEIKPSYNPLNEASIAVSGNLSSNSAIGATANNVLAIQKESLDILKRSNQFGENNTGKEIEQAEADLQEAQKTLSTSVIGISNTAEKASGGFKFSTGGAWEVGANLVTLNSDNVLHLNSPVVSSVSSVNNQQSRSFQITADVSSANLKNKYENIENTNTSVARDCTVVTTNNKLEAATHINQKAVESHTVVTAVSKVDASDIIDYNCQKDTRITAKGAIHQQASAVSIASTAESSGVAGLFGAATGFAAGFGGSVGGLASGLASSMGGSSSIGQGGITITADSGLVMRSKDSVMSSDVTQTFISGAAMTLRAKGSVTQTGAAIVQDSKGAIVQKSGAASTIMSNGFTFIGNRGFPIDAILAINKMDPLKLRSMPPLPAFSSNLSTADLEDCIPSKYKEDITPGAPENAPTEDEIAIREKSHPAPTGKDVSLISPDGSTKPTSSSPKMSSNSPLSENANGTEVNKIIGAALVVKGGADIFLSDMEAKSEVYNRVQEDLIDPDTDNATPDNTNTSFLARQREKVERAVSSIDKDNIFSLSLTDDDIKGYAISVFEPKIPELREYIANKVLDSSTPIPASLQNLYDFPGNSKLFDLLIEQTISRIESEGGLSLEGIGSVIASGINVVEEINRDGSFSNIFDVTTELLAEIFPERANLLQIASDVKTGAFFLIDNKEAISNLNLDLRSIITEPDKLEQYGEEANREIILSAVKERTYTLTISYEEILQLSDLITTNIIFYARSISSSAEVTTSDLTNLASTIRNQFNLPSLELEDIEELIYSLRDIIKVAADKRVQTVFANADLRDVINYVIGEKNARLINDVYSIYLRGKGTFLDLVNNTREGIQTARNIYTQGVNLYATLKSIPTFIGLMNTYEIPALNQVQTLLQCTDLINQFKNIYDEVKSAINTVNKISGNLEEAVNIAEDLIDIVEGKDYSGTYRGVNLLDPAEVVLDITGKILAPSPSEDETSNNRNSSNNTVPTFNPPPDESRYLLDEGGNNTENNRENNTEEVVTEIPKSNFAINTSNSTNSEDWSDTLSTGAVIETIETLPRLTQIMNSVADLSDNNELNPFVSIMSPSQIKDVKDNYLKNTETISNCYVAPKLNVAESTIVVKTIDKAILVFSMDNINLLEINQKNIFPSLNTIIQVYATQFKSIKTGEIYEVHRSEEFFSPHIYNYRVMKFNRTTNSGIAQFSPSQTRIYLKDNNNVAYNFSASDVGSKIQPIVLDAYIME